MTAPTARCVECRRAGRVPRRLCPDCREPVHQPCHIRHACAPKLARVAALAAKAKAKARLVGYRVVLTLEVDSARGSPDSWDWTSRLGLCPPERVVTEVTRLRETDGGPDRSAWVTP